MRQSASMRCYSHNITQRNNTVYIFHILFGIWLFRVNDEQWLARYYRIPPIIKSAIFSISAKSFHFASYQAPISKLWHQREDRFQQRFSQNTWQVTIEFHSVSYLTMSLLYWSTVRYDWRPSIKNGQRNNIERWNWFLPLRWRYDERDGVSNHRIIWSTVCSGADQRKHQRSTSLAFVKGIQRWPMDSPHKGPVTRKMFPFWWRHHVMYFYASGRCGVKMP